MKTNTIKVRLRDGEMSVCRASPDARWVRRVHGVSPTELIAACGDQTAEIFTIGRSDLPLGSGVCGGVVPRLAGP